MAAQERKPVSLKTRLYVTTISVVILSVWLLAFVVGEMQREEVKASLLAKNFAETSVIAENIEQNINNGIDLLNMVASLSGEILAKNPTAMQTLLMQRVELQKIFNGGALVTAIDGSYVARVLYNADDIVGQEVGLAASQTGEIQIGKPSLSPDSKRLLMTVAVPVKTSNGETLGAVSGIINLSADNFISEALSLCKVNSGGCQLVAPKSGMVIATSPNTQQLNLEHTAESTAAYERFNNGYEGSTVMNFAGDHAVVISTKAVKVAGWYVASIALADEVLAQQISLQNRTLVTATVLSVLLALLIWGILRTQLSPMLKAVQLLAAGSDTTQAIKSLPACQSYEVSLLAEGMNRMIGTLGQRDRALKEVEAKYKTLFNKMLDGVALQEVVYDAYGEPADFRFIAANPSFARLLGIDEQEIVGHTMLEVLAGEESHWVECYKQVEKTGEPVTFEHQIRKSSKYLEVTAFKSGQRQFACFVTDITPKKEAEDEILNLAFYDTLTGLANRRLLIDKLRHALSESTRSHFRGALFYIDLDNFKNVNDNHGHDLGDLLLQEAAERVLHCVRAGDTVSRVGGDEFVVMTENLSKTEEEASEQAAHIGAKLLASLNVPFVLDGIEYRTTPSIGVAVFAGGSETVDELLRRADLAMYKAKADGKNAVRFYEPVLQAVVTARAEIEAGLREACENNDLVLHYQPQVDYQNNIIGAEVLLRWQHTSRGLIYPGEFVSISEETGIILQIGQWVLEKACTQLTKWASQPQFARLTIAVNVSPKQLHHPDFVAQIKSIIERTGANPRLLKLELTESLMISNVEETIEKMNQLKDIGVGFSLDDFGTGYSSLSYLKRLPLDQLKIDRGFIREIVHNANDAAIAKMVIALGESLGLDVIAEGVEEEDQREFLASQGCLMYQGYLCGRPVPIQQFEESYIQRKAA